jgi:predicted alpha/beta hydrolase family esterase
MKKRVFIIHGWDGSPEENWFPWLKRELEARNFEVIVPQLPKSEEPRINNWIPFLERIIVNPDIHTYFVGHSMGCQVIARFLERLPDNISIGGAIFVAGFFKRLTNLENDDVTNSVAKEWLASPLDLKKVKTHLKNSVAIFSDNDPYVPLDNQEEFINYLESKIVVEHNKGHFNSGAGITELPVVLEAVLEISKRGN